MRRANEGLYESLKTARKVVKGSNEKLAEVVKQSEDKSQIAIARVKVTTFLFLIHDNTMIQYIILILF